MFLYLRIFFFFLPWKAKGSDGEAVGAKVSICLLKKHIDKHLDMFIDEILLTKNADKNLHMFIDEIIRSAKIMVFPP